MNFTKWQACGNDFIFINAINLDITEIINQAKLLCDRHFGIGADGIIFILPSNKADLKMRIFNLIIYLIFILRHVTIYVMYSCTL